MRLEIAYDLLGKFKLHSMPRSVGRLNKSNRSRV